MNLRFFNKISALVSAGLSLYGLPLHTASAQTINTLYNFSQNAPANETSGQYAQGVLIQDPSGNLYGVTVYSSGGNGTVYKSTTLGATQTIHNFLGGATDGGNPNGRLALDSSGNLYGCTWVGGSSNGGILYVLSPSGNTYSFTILHSFTGYNSTTPSASDGANLNEGPTLVGTTLYGVSNNGGTHNQGTVWSYDISTSSYSVLYSMGSSSSSDGVYPNGGLLYNSSDQRLYGTTKSGGSSGNGTIFSLNTNGTGYDSYSFTGNGPGTNGQAPNGRLVKIGSVMYGLCERGGPLEQGALFSFTHSGSSYTVNLFHVFDGVTGSYPYTALCVGKDNNLYGLTCYGGANGYGVAFKTISSGSSAGTTTVLHSFNGVDAFFVYDNFVPAGLMQGKDGNFYGISFYGGVAAVPGVANGNGDTFKMTPKGGVTILTSFYIQDMYNSQEVGILQATDGEFYGGTENGGAFYGGGLFRTDAAGNLSFLHYFDNNTPYYDGYANNDPYIQGTDGNLYGGTDSGGYYGNGTLWQCSLSGAYKVLHSFIGTEQGYLGWIPFQGADKAIYGTAVNGGPNGAGTLWSCTTAGAFSVLHYFDYYAPEGRNPWGIWYQDSGKYLYGLSDNGATSNGTIWKVLPNGTGFTLLHSFNNSSGEGYTPRVMIPIPGSSPLAFYGLCVNGGANGGGTIWKFAPSTNSFTVLHAFSGSSSDGAYPYSLNLAPDGNIYATTWAGGTANDGTLIQINPSTLSYSVEVSFTGANGQNPYGTRPLCIGSDGLFYSTTQNGGLYGNGTIFSIDTGLVNAVDVSSSVTVSSVITVSTKTAKVTIKNTGSSKVTLLGPIQLVITGTTPSGLSVTSETGTVPAGFPVSGDPYQTVLSNLPHNILSLKPGASVTLNVVFSAAPTSFTTKVYTGRF